MTTNHTLHRLLCLVLSLVLTLSLMTSAVFADDPAATEPESVTPTPIQSDGGSCGTSVNWSFDDSTGVLTLSGTGATKTYGKGSAPWYKYRAAITSLVIDNGITGLTQYLFYGLTALTEVTIPNSVTSLGLSLCEGCTALTSITFGTGVTLIPSSCCSGCTALTSVTFLGSLGSISKEAFLNCSSLTSFSLPSSVQIISEKALSGTGLTTFNLPSGLTSFDSSACGNCPNLTAYTVSSGNSNYSAKNGILYDKDQDSLVAVPGAFSGVFSMPSGVTTIAAYAFFGCTGLTGVTLPSRLTTIPKGCFRGCTGLTALTIPSTVTAINSEAFYGCTGLTQMEIPSGVTAISIDVFHDCTGLTSVSLPSSITTINNSAFQGCTALPAITIPSAVTTIGTYAFCDCTSLTSIVIPSGVKIINDYCFQNCKVLSSVTLPAALTTIKQAAFKNCPALPAITLPTTLTTIGTSAFCGCSSLGAIVIPSGVKVIPSSCFMNCVSLVSADLPDGITTISGYAFQNCFLLSEITMPAALTTLGNYSFYACRSIPSVVIPNGVKIIPNYCFYACSSMEELTLSANLTTINSNAFRGCSALPAVTLPDTLTTINTYAFAECASLTAITVPALVKAITAYDFYGCSSLASVTLPEGLTSIASYAFASCSSLPEITIPETVTTLSSYAFHACPALRSVTLPNSITSFGSNVFAGNTGMTVNGTHLTPVYGGAADGNSYDGSTTTVVKSHLYPNADGGVTRVELRNGNVNVETYNAIFSLTDAKRLEPELPIFGGFYAGKDYYFLVFGQNNPNADNNAEVIRVVRYTKDWVRDGQASICGANTSVPFECGSLHMAEYNGVLYVRTCHETYNNQQASMTFSVRIQDMSVLENHSGSGPNGGYTTRSLNQLIAIDSDGTIVTADHGDAAPRQIVLRRSVNPAGSANCLRDNSSVCLLSLYGATGASTGACLGGLEISDTAYLTAGCSIPQDGSGSTQKNIFVTMTPKNAFTDSDTVLTWITSYESGAGVTVMNPQLVKLDGSHFALLWREGSKLCFVTLDANGTKTSEIRTLTGIRSQCQPVVVDGKLTWYAAKYTSGYACPCFFQMDPAAPTAVEAIDIDPCYATKLTLPTADTAGSATLTCLQCPDSHTVTLPAFNQTDYVLETITAPTCSAPGLGRWTWKGDRNRIVNASISFEAELSADPSLHQYLYTDNGNGTHTGTCSVCGDSLTEAHTFVDGVCVCGAVQNVQMNLSIGMTLSLEGATSVNYLVPKAALDAYGLDSFKMVVVHTDYDRDTGVYSEETRELAAEAELYVAGGANYYKFVYAEIPAMKLNDVMIARVEGEKDGVTFTSAVLERNPVQYCYIATNNAAAGENLQKTCANMILYAAAAQTYFNYNTANLATAAWTQTQEALCERDVPAWENIDSREPLESGKLVNIIGTTLDVNSRVDMRYVMSFEDGVDYTTLTMYCTYTTYQDDTVTVEIPGTTWTDYQGYKAATMDVLNAAEMRSLLTAVVKDANGNVVSETYYTNVQSYGCKVYNNASASQNLKDLMVAMVNYGDAAEVLLKNK